MRGSPPPSIVIPIDVVGETPFKSIVLVEATPATYIELSELVSVSVLVGVVAVGLVPVIGWIIENPALSVDVVSRVPDVKGNVIVTSVVIAGLFSVRVVLVVWRVGSRIIFFLASKSATTAKSDLAILPVSTNVLSLGNPVMTLPFKSVICLPILP